MKQIYAKYYVKNRNCEGRRGKCRKLRAQQPQNNNIYREKLLYINLIVTTNQKSIIDTHTKKRKESKHNTEDSDNITREENKRKGKE